MAEGVRRGDRTDLGPVRPPGDAAPGRELLVSLLSPIERKNGWWLAEHAGHASPDRMQRLLRTAVWDHDGAAEDLRDLVTTRLDHPEVVFVIDETGFLEKGIGSVGGSDSTRAPPGGSKTARAECS